MSRLPRSLRTRLLVANLIVVGAALGTVVVAVSLVGPGYFADAMGHRPGDPMGAAMDAATRVAFNDAIRNALLAAGVIAVVTAIVVSLAVSAAIAGPVTRLVAAARRIARGHYAERVPEEGDGELGELASSFNAMTGSLEATEQRRLQLVGDVAHELRTPLSTLDGYLEGLEDGVVAPTGETWRLLRGETARLTRLVDDLQELWRAEARSCRSGSRRSTRGPSSARSSSSSGRRSLLDASTWSLTWPPGSRSVPTGTGSPRSSPTTSPTRSAIALTVGPCRCRPAGSKTRWRSSSSTAGPASPSSNAGRSSSASIGSIHPDPGHSAGPASASPSRGRWRARWMAASGSSSPGRGRVRPSRSPFPLPRAATFWRLHAFIQARFESRLRTVRRIAGQTAADTIAEIETVDHPAVPSI